MGDFAWMAIVAAILLVSAVVMAVVAALMQDWMMMANAGVLAGVGCGAALLSLRE